MAKNEIAIDIVTNNADVACAQIAGLTNQLNKACEAAERLYEVLVKVDKAYEGFARINTGAITKKGKAHEKHNRATKKVGR